MVQAYIILGVVLGLPLLLGLVFRVNSSFLFFSILAGELLARYFGYDTELATRLLVHSGPALAYTNLILLTLPVVLTAIFLRHTLSRGKLLIYIIPFAITGVVFAAFALPMLSGALQQHVRTVRVGQLLFESSRTIVGVVVFMQLIALWVLNRSHGHGKSH